MKKLIKAIIPEQIILWYHACVALMATMFYGFPSKKMVVIGVTGTKGKTSTTNFIWSCLTSAGYKTGMISTANIRIGEDEELNSFHMTMPGRFAIQRFLAQMVKEGCTHCVVETTSEGIKQFRHVGVYYDIGVFTNLSPEHLPSHGGSFEKYKQTKGRMFKALISHEKHIDGGRVEKMIFANTDNEHADYYLSFPADRKVTFGIEREADIVASNVQASSDGITFSVGDTHFESPIIGAFNVYNILPAIAISREFGVEEEKIVAGIKNLAMLPGRMERIEEGQDYTVLVDYAHEGKSMAAAVSTARTIADDDHKVIVILGAEGGGRDTRKRGEMGKVVGEKANVAIVSAIDPYEDDPETINEDVAQAVEQAGKVRNEDLFVITDRRRAIRKALQTAEAGDVVLVTGKGSEQTMNIYGKVLPWDDRVVVREELEEALK